MKEVSQFDRPYSMAASGMKLERLEEIIKMAMSLGTADQRYEARHKPIKVVFRTDCTHQELVITEMKLEGNNIVLLLNSEF